MAIARYLEDPVARDLAEKMVFLAGPRQVGKTTAARRILEACGPGAYFSWDRREDRRDIREARWPPGRALVVLDELHKYRQWKRWLKGEFDANRQRLRFLVTGSARLEVYRKGGDSLQGRYHHYRLHPFSCAEIAAPGRPLPDPGAEVEVPASSSRETLDALMEYGGFPEPFLAQSPRTLRRWRKERLDRFFREDVRDLETIRDLSAMETLADLLAERVASPLSLNSLREDLEASHRAVSHWVEVLDRLYFAFRVPPFAGKASHGLRKRAKVYLWDSTSVADRGARFENLVALHLLKFCHLLEDREGHRTQLLYLRDSFGREVDFLVTVDRKPWFAVEAKTGEPRVEPALRYYRDRLKIPWAYQVVLDGTRDFVQDGVRCLPAHRFLAALA
jgi:predicted AAA+ superfamily ATPase